MPRPKTPLAKAIATGRTLRDPARFAGQFSNMQLGTIGDPPDWMKSQKQREAWCDLTAEIPWLNSSHRAILEIACVMRARLAGGGEVGVNAMNLLRLCLAQMGATPVDAGKIAAPAERETDPAERYF